MGDPALPDAPAAAGRAEGLGRLMVALQFGLLALMGWRAWQAAPQLAAMVVPLLVASVALALWALTANRPGNFNIRPTPRPGGRLVTGGPYRWVRHPMYTAVLLAAAAAAVQAGAGVDAGLWLALLLVLWFKATLEERALVQRFPDYRDYQRRSTRFLPWWI